MTKKDFQELILSKDVYNSALRLKSDSNSDFRGSSQLTLFMKSVLSESVMAPVVLVLCFDSVFCFCKSYILSCFSWSFGYFMSPHFVFHFVESFLLS